MSGRVGHICSLLRCPIQNMTKILCTKYMDASIEEWIDGWMDGWTDGQMDGLSVNIG